MRSIRAGDRPIAASSREVMDMALAMQTRANEWPSPHACCGVVKSVCCDASALTEPGGRGDRSAPISHVLRLRRHNTGTFAATG
jgi:hypothetical protein